MLKLTAFFLFTFAALLLIVSLGVRTVHELWSPPKPPPSITCVAQITQKDGTFYQVEPLATTLADCSNAIDTLSWFGANTTVKAVSGVPPQAKYVCLGILFQDAGDIWELPHTRPSLATYIQGTCQPGSYSSPNEPK